MKTEARGIIQSDILVRSAVIEALRRLQSDQKLFDHIFQSLADDPLTRDEYGEKEMAAAKSWFYGDESKKPVVVPVFMSYRVDKPVFPCISISLMESTEAEQTHGDVHYVPQEPVEADWPPLAGPFDPVTYMASSGIMQLPPSIGDIILLPGMWVTDRAGRPHMINEVLDDCLVSISPNTIADFKGCFLKGAQPRLIETLESVNMRETYQLGVHVQGESTYLAYLHAIVLFGLLHFKQELFEERGVERTSISSSEFLRNKLFNQELVFSRGITINGFVRQTWPKNKRQIVDRAAASFIFEKPDSPEPVPTSPDVGELWVAQVDE